MLFWKCQLKNNYRIMCIFLFFYKEVGSTTEIASLCPISSIPNTTLTLRLCLTQCSLNMISKFLFCVLLLTFYCSILLVSQALVIHYIPSFLHSSAQIQAKQTRCLSNLQTKRSTESKNQQQ